MVSQPAARDQSSRGRLLAAAASEFAARGFDGAKVDRIARRARINKAMVYYHFRNKAALYRAILGDVFQALAKAVEDAGAGPGDPEARLRGFIRAIAAETGKRPHFPPIWLREMAEGGRHLDPSIVKELSRVLKTLAAILADGKTSGRFTHEVNPFVTQISIVAPLLLFAASAPIRERFKNVGPFDVAAMPPEAVLSHVEAATLQYLSSSAPGEPALVPKSPRSRRQRS